MSGTSSDISSDAPAARIHKRWCVTIPSYNNGPEFEQLVRDVLAVWQPVIVVIDGSTDGSDEAVNRLAESEPGLHVLTHPYHSGRGVAVFAAFNYAIDNAFTHAAVFDPGGRNDVEDLRRFMGASQKEPGALIMGVPQFSPDAPKWSVLGHRAADRFGRLITTRRDFDSSLFGLRVYPLYSALKVMQKMHGGYRGDFDVHMAVRLAWHRYPVVKLPAKLRYPQGARGNTGGGVSHFLRLAYAHAYLLIRSTARWPQAIARRFVQPRPFDIVKNR